MINSFTKEKEQISDQNITISEENRQNRSQICELLEKIETLQKIIDEQNNPKVNVNKIGVVHLA